MSCFLHFLIINVIQMSTMLAHTILSILIKMSQRRSTNVQRMVNLWQIRYFKTPFVIFILTILSEYIEQVLNLEPHVFLGLFPCLW